MLEIIKGKCENMNFKDNLWGHYNIVILENLASIISVNP